MILNSFKSTQRAMASLPEQCCTFPPFKSDYKPIGERCKLSNGDLEIYTTGPRDAEYALVAIHGRSLMSSRSQAMKFLTGFYSQTSSACMPTRFKEPTYSPHKADIEERCRTSSEARLGIRTISHREKAGRYWMLGSRRWARGKRSDRICMRYIRG